MGSRTLLALVKTGAVAGLVAGLALGLFHFVVSEPIIDEAIALEEAALAAQGETAGESEGPIVSRGAQKGMLVLGSGLLGVLIGVVFAGAYRLTRTYLPGADDLLKVGALAVTAWWSVAFLPFLKYPANPPAVGDPETIYLRQTIYVVFLVLSVVAVVIAVAAHRRLRGMGWGGTAASLSALGLYGVLATALFVLMPPNPDEVMIPAGLLWNFRIASLFGAMFQWGVLGGAFGLIWRRWSSAQAAQPGPATA